MIRSFPSMLALLVLYAALPMQLASAGQEDSWRLAILDAGDVGIVQALGVGERVVLMPEDPSLQGGLPNAERFHRIVTAEGLVALTPDVVISGNPDRSLESSLLEQAERLGIRTVVIERTLPPVERVKRLAELTGAIASGQQLIASIRQDHQRALERIDDTDPVRVLHVSSAGAGNSGSVTGAGKGTSAHGLIERAGGVNVGAQAGLERYQTLSAEGVIAMAPEAVLVSDQELTALGGRDGIWQRVPGLAHTPAARHRRLIVLDHGAVKYDGATSGRATLMLARRLHP